MFNAVKRLTGVRPNSGDTVKDHEGKLITDTKLKIEDWAAHIRQILNRPTQQQIIIEPINTALSEVDTSPGSETEITTTIKKLKNNKIAGSDGIASEMFKHVLESLTSALEHLLKLIGARGQSLKNAKTALIASGKKISARTNKESLC